MSKRPGEWDHGELRKLRRLFGEGKSYREIGEALGRSFHSVHRAVHVHEIGGDHPYLYRGVDREDRVLSFLAINGPARLCALSRSVGESPVTVFFVLRRAIGKGCAVRLSKGLYAIGPEWTEERRL